MKGKNAVIALLAVAAGAMFFSGSAIDADRAMRLKRAENDARITAACLPSERGEQRLVEYRIDGQGREVVAVTVRKFLGHKKQDMQYAVIATEELVP